MMRKHTRSTPAGVPRSRSKFTRAQRKSSRWIGCWMHYSGHYTFGVDVASGPSRSVCKIVDLLATPA